MIFYFPNANIILENLFTIIYAYVIFDTIMNKILNFIYSDSLLEFKNIINFVC